MNTFVRHRLWLLAGLCSATAAAVLILMPAEKTIGQAVKIVYLHGALSRAGMAGFLAAGALGLAYLARPRPALARWSQALLASGWAFWTAHFIVSMPATRLTWGPWIAWGEPRVTMTLQLMAAGLAVILVCWLLKDPRFAAGAGALYATARQMHPAYRLRSSPAAASGAPQPAVRCWQRARECCVISWIRSVPHRQLRCA